MYVTLYAGCLGEHMNKSSSLCLENKMLESVNLDSNPKSFWVTIYVLIICLHFST